MRGLLLFVAAVAACGGDPTPDALVIDPTVVTVLVLANDAPVAAGRDVTVITSDGATSTIQTDATGHAYASFGSLAMTATVYTDSHSAEGRFTTQGAVLGDRICLGCAYTTTTEGCAALPTVTGLAKTGQGWAWQLSGAQPYAGMIISWTSTGANGGGRIISPPGATSASTFGSANVTIEILARDDVPTYDVMRSLTRTSWARDPFCATTVHRP